MIGDHFLILLDHLLSSRNPNNAVDDGSIPTSHEIVSFIGKCAMMKVKLKAPIVKNLPSDLKSPR